MISSFLSMISAQTLSAFVARENRFPLFRIMLYFSRRTASAGLVAPSSPVSTRAVRSALCGPR